MNGVPDGVLVGAAVVLLASAPASSWLALRRDRQPVAWFLFGAILGPVAIALLLVSPPGRCPRCDTPVRGWPTACPVCAWEFRPAVQLPDRLASALRGLAAPAAARRSAEPPLPDDAADAAAVTRWVEAAGDPSGTAEPVPPVAADAPASTAGLAVTPLPAPAPLEARATRFAGNGLPPAERQQATSAERPDDSPAGVARSDGTPVIVATGVFAGGNVNLEVGARYVLGREGENLVILGPVDRTPHEVRVALPVDRVDLLSIEDRVLVAARDRDRDRLNFAFIAAAGMRGRALEEALAVVVDAGGADLPS
jgi:hypothetical protein